MKATYHNKIKIFLQQVIQNIFIYTLVFFLSGNIKRKCSHFFSKLLLSYVGVIIVLSFVQYSLIQFRLGQFFVIQLINRNALTINIFFVAFDLTMFILIMVCKFRYAQINQLSFGTHSLLQFYLAQSSLTSLA